MSDLVTAGNHSLINTNIYDRIYFTFFFTTYAVLKT